MNNIIKENSCCFIGHRKIEYTEKLISNLKNILETLINENNVINFIFGSRSQFNDICYKLVTELKQNYPNIKRIYVRAEYPVINKDYEEYLLRHYEYTFFPDIIKNAGKAIYVERNQKIIDLSKFCIMYYNKNINRKSGTKLAYQYAQKRRVNILNIFE